MDHLRALLKHADYKGSDVRLSSKSLLDGSRQEWPYPALAWQRVTRMAYKWREAQHINQSGSVRYGKRQIKRESVEPALEEICCRGSGGRRVRAHLVDDQLMELC
eukprot:1291833-Pyramimonas_sp.AAC.1